VPPGHRSPQTLDPREGTIVGEATVAPGTQLADRVRAAHRNYPTGVTVITTSVDGKPYGLAVNAFSSVSLEPPTLLFCVNESSKTHEHLLRATHVGVNILGFHQHEVAGVFARSGGDKFSEIDWTPGIEGIPLITGAAARFQTQVTQTTKVGTHTVFFCTVVEAEAEDHQPLLYLRGAFVDGRKMLDDTP
jgi:flavin reductase (DIM6/NTAB) family NADH-FMN oxidoreductase RutF